MTFCVLCGAKLDTSLGFPGIPDRSGRGFQGVRQLLLLIFMATAGGFPGIPVWNGHKEREVCIAIFQMRRSIQS